MTGTASAADAAGGGLGGFDAAAVGYDTHGVAFFSAIAARLVQQAGVGPGDRVLRAWLRVLRPGGTVAFSWNIAEDSRWVPVIAAVDVYVPGAGSFDAVLHHAPFASIDAVQAMMEDAGCTGAATTAETTETRYTGPRQWWAASWSQAPRIAWQHIPPGRRETARTAAFGLLDPLRDQNDGSLARRPVIGYTIARKPASPATPKAPAR
jgi:hypothetical protein